MGRKKKKQGPSGPPGAPEWVVTFTDMISLLVTFFVLLMTFSSMDPDEMLRVDAFLSGNKGVFQTRGSDAVEFSNDDLISASDILRGSRRPHSRPADKLPEAVEDMGQKRREQDVALDLNQVADGIVLEFDPQDSFDRGSARVSDHLRRTLTDVGEVLSNYPHMIVVEGATDGDFRPTREHPTADDLAFARASAAASVLLRVEGLTPELVQIASLGDRSPRADDATAEGRQLNRRIQIRILSLSRLRAAYLEEAR